MDCVDYLIILNYGHLSKFNKPRFSIFTRFHTERSTSCVGQHLPRCGTIPCNVAVSSWLCIRKLRTCECGVLSDLAGFCVHCISGARSAVKEQPQSSQISNKPVSYFKLARIALCRRKLEPTTRFSDSMSSANPVSSEGGVEGR